MEREKILKLKIESDDFPIGTTIRSYLMSLLATLWEEKECFSGKRPLGNSGWDYDLYLPLVKAKVISGSIDEDGYLAEFDAAEGDRIIMECIDSI